MKNKEFISIIITSYNSSKFIKEVVKSILDQTYQNFEIVFVDDCSKDSTYEYLKKIKKKFNKKIVLLKTKKNSQARAPPLGVNVFLTNAAATVRSVGAV